jgi:hypothetical protein
MSSPSRNSVTNTCCAALCKHTDACAAISAGAGDGVVASQSLCHSGAPAYIPGVQSNLIQSNPPTHSVAYAYTCPMAPLTPRLVASAQGVAASSSPAGSASQFFAQPPRAGPPSPSPATSFSQYTAPATGVPSHPQGNAAWPQQTHAVPAPEVPSHPQGDAAWPQQPHAVPAPAGVSALHLLAVCDRVQPRRAVGHTALHRTALHHPSLNPRACMLAAAAPGGPCAGIGIGITWLGVGWPFVEQRVGPARIACPVAPQQRRQLPHAVVPAPRRPIRYAMVCTCACGVCWCVTPLPRPPSLAGGLDDIDLTGAQTAQMPQPAHPHSSSATHPPIDREDSLDQILAAPVSLPAHSGGASKAFLEPYSPYAFDHDHDHAAPQYAAQAQADVSVATAQAHFGPTQPANGAAIGQYIPPPESAYLPPDLARAPALTLPAQPGAFGQPPPFTPHPAPPPMDTDGGHASALAQPITQDHAFTPHPAPPPLDTDAGHASALAQPITQDHAFTPHPAPPPMETDAGHASALAQPITQDHAFTPHPAPPPMDIHPPAAPAPDMRRPSHEPGAAPPLFPNMYPDGTPPATGVRCDAMRCDAMRCDAMRCDAMRCDAMRREAALGPVSPIEATPPQAPDTRRSSPTCIPTASKSPWRRVCGPYRRWPGLGGPMSCRACRCA